MVLLDTETFGTSREIFKIRFWEQKNIQQRDNDYCLEVSLLIDNYWLVDGS